MPQFDCIAGHFESVGQCRGYCCANEGWDLLDGLCWLCFRVQVVEPKQHDLDSLWSLYEAVWVFGRGRQPPTGPDSGHSPARSSDEIGPRRSNRGRLTNEREEF